MEKQKEQPSTSQIFFTSAHFNGEKLYHFCLFVIFGGDQVALFIRQENNFWSSLFFCNAQKFLCVFFGWDEQCKKSHSQYYGQHVGNKHLETFNHGLICLYSDFYSTVCTRKLYFKAQLKIDY